MTRGRIRQKPYPSLLLNIMTPMPDSNGMAPKYRCPFCWVQFIESQTNKLWKTIKNSEYSIFHTLRVIHSTCQCPQSGNSHFYSLSRFVAVLLGWGVSMPSVGQILFLRQRRYPMKTDYLVCQCPQSGDTHFYPASLEPAYLAAFRARFCRYFSEYSDNCPKTGLKVGRRQNVLF